MPSQCHPDNFTYAPEQIARLRDAISHDRFSTYLAHTKGDERLAVRQYERNTALSETLYGVLQGFEVALRNSMHRVMSHAMGVEDWFSQAGLGEYERLSIDAAREKISNKRKPITPSRIVAESTFGFWVALAGRRYNDSLWIPHLHRAFPFRRLGRKDAFERLTAIRTLRNSVAHHECIIFRDLAKEYRDVIEAAKWICPDTATWIRKTTRFEASHRYLYKSEAIKHVPPATRV